MKLFWRCRWCRSIRFGTPPAELERAGGLRIPFCEYECMEAYDARER